jgi:hypothetical protein
MADPTAQNPQITVTIGEYTDDLDLPTLKVLSAIIGQKRHIKGSELREVVHAICQALHDRKIPPTVYRIRAILWTLNSPNTISEHRKTWPNYHIYNRDQMKEEEGVIQGEVMPQEADQADQREQREGDQSDQKESGEGSGRTRELALVLDNRVREVERSFTSQVDVVRRELSQRIDSERTAAETRDITIKTDLTGLMDRERQATLDKMRATIAEAVLHESRQAQAQVQRIARFFGLVLICVIGGFGVIIWQLKTNPHVAEKTITTQPAPQEGGGTKPTVGVEPTLPTTNPVVGDGKAATNKNTEGGVVPTPKPTEEIPAPKAEDQPVDAGTSHPDPAKP